MNCARLLFGVFVCSQVAAGVRVEIVDCPTSVLLYAPVIVTARVVNDGAEVVVVPASNSPDNRWLFEQGTDASKLQEYRPTIGEGLGGVRVLKPGEAWFFQVDLARTCNAAERYFVRAAIRSNGRCFHRAVGSEGLALKRIKDDPEMYECWSGVAESEAQTFEVVKAVTPIDREVMNVLGAKGFVSACGQDGVRERLKCSFGYLRDRFPGSNYTFVSGLWACGRSAECLESLLELQPDNPLGQYARLKAALARIRSGEGGVTEASVRQMDLPGGQKEYVLQRLRMGR